MSSSTNCSIITYWPFKDVLMARYCEARNSIRATQQHRAKEKETSSKFACMTQMRGFPAGNRISWPSITPSNGLSGFGKEFPHLKQLVHASCLQHYSQRLSLSTCWQQVNWRQLENGTVVHMINQLGWLGASAVWKEIFPKHMWRAHVACLSLTDSLQEKI